MKLIKIFIIIFMFVFPGNLCLWADSFNADNAMYVEFGGQSPIISFNYEHLIGTDSSDVHNLAIRMGIGFDFGGPTFPFVASYLCGRSHHVEAGGGIVLLGGNEDANNYFLFIPTVYFGYRYQKPAGGFVFKAGVAPLLRYDGKYPWVGISLGFAF